MEMYLQKVISRKTFASVATAIKDDQDKNTRQHFNKGIVRQLLQSATPPH
jgi:hypothetical protein